MKLLDIDHVLLKNGKIYRVLGNFDMNDSFFGYNVYSPNENGDRLFEGKRYIKNFIEDNNLPEDAMDTYEIIAKKDIIRHFDPLISAQTNNKSF